MAKAKLDETRKLINKGDKLLKGSFFAKKKPNEAEKSYEAAKKIIRFLKPVTLESTMLYITTLNGLKNAQEAQSFWNSAGKSMEEAARLCVNSKFDKIKSKAYEYYDKAGYYFRMNGQYDHASKQIQKAAELLGEIDVDGGIKLFKKCVSINEDELRHRQTQEFFDAAIRFCIVKKRYKDAIEFMERQMKEYEFDRFDLRKRIYRNTVSIVIIYCYIKDVKSAQKVFYDHLSKYKDLKSTDELEMAEEILKIYELKDQDGLNKFKKNQNVGLYLLSAVGRLVKKMDLDGIIKIASPDIDFKKTNNNNIVSPEEKVRDELKQNINPDLLKSTINTDNINDDGAPDLLIDGTDDNENDINNNDNNNGNDINIDTNNDNNDINNDDNPPNLDETT